MQDIKNIITIKQRITEYLIKILLAVGIIFISLGIISVSIHFLIFRIYVNQPDQKDYYGTYYAFTGSEIITVELKDGNICSFRINDGEKGKYNEFNYKYLPALKSKQSTLSILPSIEIYQKSQGVENRVYTFIVLTKKPYRFLFLESFTFFTTEEISLEDKMNDPQNYYGTYVCDSKKIEIRSTGYLSFIEHHNETSYKHEYRNKNWVKIKFPDMKDSRGALFVEGLSKYIFIIDENTLYFEGETYYKE